MKVGDRVMIKERYLGDVTGYQSKSLGFRRLVGEVTKVARDGVEVDFIQWDLPRRGANRKYGDKVRINKWVGPLLPPGKFPEEILEVVKVREVA